MFTAFSCFGGGQHLSRARRKLDAGIREREEMLGEDPKADEAGCEGPGTYTFERAG
jgi:hypothetical protein